MYLLRLSLIEICKIFLGSIVCSIIFAFMIYSDTALPNPFICFVLNGAAFLIFMYINYFNWTKLYDNTYSNSEYYVPAISAALSYAVVSSYCYSKRVAFYMWVFLPTRFLEPRLNSSYLYLTVVASCFLLFVLLFAVPHIGRRYN